MCTPVRAWFRRELRGVPVLCYLGHMGCAVLRIAALVALSYNVWSPGESRSSGVRRFRALAASFSRFWENPDCCLDPCSLPPETFPPPPTLAAWE